MPLFSFKNVLLISFLSFASTLTSKALSAGDDPLITCTVAKGSLTDAIQMLGQAANIQIIFERSLLDRYTVPSKTFTEVQLSVAIRQLLATTRLQLVIQDGKFLIGPAPGPENGTSAVGNATLSGYVADASSGERLVGVTIGINGAATTTNNYGYFSITVPAGIAEIRISMVGYQTLTDTLLLQQNIHRTFAVNRQSIVLDDIEITASASPAIQQRTQMGHINLSVEQIQSAPRFMGEADVLKTVQLLPGVQQGSEGTSALLVRGGSPDQNMFLLDGTPLYNPSHLLGIFSTFNTSTLKNVDLYKGAFPARFGGRLSSVLDITTKDGNLNELHGDFSIGSMASQFTLEGPLKKGKTSFVLSGRRTYADLVARPFMGNLYEEVDKFGVFFHDINVKVHHKFSDDDRVFFSVYSGRDYFRARTGYERGFDYGNAPEGWYSRSQDDFRIGWGNHTGTIRWNHIFGPKLFANVSLMGSQYRFHTAAASETSNPDNRTTSDNELTSGIRDFGGKIDFDYRPHPNHAVKAGVGVINHRFTPGSSSLSYDMGRSSAPVNVSLSTVLYGNEINVYAEDEWRLSPKASVNLGLHGSMFATAGKTYAYAQPRISGRILLPGDVAFKMGYAQMAQYLHLLSNNTISLPTDLWVPATSRVKPQLAQQLSAGFARSIAHNTVELSVEGYYKNMDNVIEYKEGELYFATADKDWEHKVTSGNGRAFGMEFFVHKKVGRLNGWAGYTWAKTNRKIEGVNFDRRFPYKYDRRHEFKALAIYKLSKGIHISGSWVYQSATPFTLVLGEYEGISDPMPYGYDTRAAGNEHVPLVNSRNNVRLEDYHRLDISIDFVKIKRSGNQRIWNVSVYNVYNRKNPFTYYPDGGIAGGGQYQELTRVTLLPILPSISYILKF